MTRHAAARLLTRLALTPRDVERHISDTWGDILTRYYQGERDHLTCHAAAQAEQLRRAARMVTRRKLPVDKGSHAVVE